MWLEIVVHRNGEPIRQRPLDELVRELVEDCEEGLSLRRGDLELLAVRL
jgi:hypothetical protein